MPKSHWPTTTTTNDAGVGRHRDPDRQRVTGTEREGRSNEGQVDTRAVCRTRSRLTCAVSGVACRA